jgi:large subunit ribosomal protein L29
MAKSNNYRELSVETLKDELNQLLTESFSIKMQKMTGQETKLHLIKKIRRNIARVKTILAEKGVAV